MHLDSLRLSLASIWLRDSQEREASSEKGGWSTPGVTTTGAWKSAGEGC